MSSELRLWWHAMPVALALVASGLLWGGLFIPEKWSGFELYGVAFVAWIVAVVVAAIVAVPEDWRGSVTRRFVWFVGAVFVNTFAGIVTLVAVYAIFHGVWGPYRP